MTSLLALALMNASALQASPDPYANETPAQRDARMKWFREARFGMFIHWGVYSVPAGTYKGQRIGGIGEWIMNTGKIPMSDYQAYAKEFNPTNFNAEQWVQIAKNAGMKYIVITSKHHDGFAMFHSKVSDWNIYDATPFKRDPLKELAAACKKNGIRLGFYYSQAQDWNHPGGAAAGGHWDKGQDGDMSEYVKNIAVPQMKEILTNYGPVACLWWDTPVGITKGMADELIANLKLQPGIIHNNRLGGGYKGDTETPEQFIPATGYPGGRDWETCMTMNDTWGYKSYDQNWKSSETIIRNLIDIASKGGNYLLNVGPTNMGEIPGPSQDRLKVVGDWMKQNSKAIYATTASPFKKLAWGRCTKTVDKNGATLYLHVFDWPMDGKLVVPGLKNKVESASMLVGGKRLNAGNAGENVIIEVPSSSQNVYSTTVVLRVKGALEVVQPEFTVTQKDNGDLDLNPNDAELHGDEIQVEGGNDGNIGFWTNPSDWASWTFRMVKPGTYKVYADIASLGTGSFTIDYSGASKTITAPNTGSYQKFQRTQLGTIEVKEAGKATISVHAVAKGWAPINLKTIHIRSAGQ